MSVRSFARVAAALVAFLAACGCAVGPDFENPPPPEVGGYTREKLAPRTSSTNVTLGQSQRFVAGKDLPGEWWRLFHSPPLNALVSRSIDANPNLSAALHALRAAREGVYAQQGKYFPVVGGNANATRQLTAGSIGPVLNSGENPFNLYTAQVLVSYTLDVWGGNRRAVESQQAAADNQRFAVEAAYLTLTSNVALAAIQDALLRGQIDATNRLIEINSKMLDMLRTQFDRGLVSRIDVAAQEAALAQIRATLPPLRKALAQNRDLIAALAGRLPSEMPGETFKLEALHLPTDLPLSLPSQLVEQRPDVRASRSNCMRPTPMWGSRSPTCCRRSLSAGRRAISVPISPRCLRPRACSGISPGTRRRRCSMALACSIKSVPRKTRSIKPAINIAPQ